MCVHHFRSGDENFSFAKNQLITSYSHVLSCAQFFFGRYAEELPLHKQHLLFKASGVSDILGRLHRRRSIFVVGICRIFSFSFSKKKTTQLVLGTSLSTNFVS